MKTFITTLLLMCISVSFSQEYYMHDYRMIPDNQIQNHIDNEKHFWSKVAQTLIKEGKLTGWAMLQRQGGSSNEPNFYFYIGIGDKSNLKNLGATFNYGAEKIYSSMGKDAAALVKRSIDINPHSFYNVILQSTNREAKKNSNGYNFLKINYSNVIGDVAEFDNLQKNVWGNFVSKEMNKNNGSQVLWTTARKVSPNGNGYNWNYITIDGYESYDDLLSPEWNSNTKFPADLSKINSMMQGENFYKQVVWKILMSVDNEGNFKEH